MKVVKGNVGHVPATAFAEIVGKAAKGAEISDAAAEKLFSAMQSALRLNTAKKDDAILEGSEQLRGKCNVLGISHARREKFVSLFTSGAFADLSKTAETREDRSAMYFMSCIVRNLRDE